MIFDESYSEYKLDNGLQVALKKTSTNTFSGKLRVFHGSLNEHEGEEGIAHLLEHAVLTCGTGDHSPDEIEEKFSDFGYSNGTTSLEMTTFPVDSLQRDLETYLDVISSVAFEPALLPEELEKEKRVVLREISQYKSTPHFNDMNAYREELFGKNSPYTKTPLGKEDIVRNATPKDLNDFHKRGYNAGNMDLVLVGALPDNIDNLIEKYFANRKRGDNIRFDFAGSSTLPGGKILQKRAPDLINEDEPEESNSEIYIGIPGPSLDSGIVSTAEVLGEVLGDSMYSLLAKKVRKELGLAYNIGGRFSSYQNRCIFGFQASVSTKNLDAAIEAIFGEFSAVQSAQVSEDLIQKIKRKSAYKLAKGQESNGGQMSAIHRKLDYGLTSQQLLDEILSVTEKDVADVARKYLPSNSDDGNYVMLVRNPLLE